MRKFVFFTAPLVAGLILAGASAMAAGMSTKTPNSGQASQCQTLLSQFKQQAPSRGHSAAWTMWAAARQSCHIGRYGSGIATITNAMRQVGLHPNV